ncbi:hypothetical protein ACFLYJ_00690 [Candidatus Cloacimonadota bacterium]
MIINFKRKANFQDSIVLVIIISISFIILEKIHPYYFLSDDNRTFYLPLFAHNLRALTNGELPLFNWQQYLGIAHFSNFQSAIFYPLTYFSMFLSKLFSGHIFWTMDIAVFFHFIIGSIGFYQLVKYFTEDRSSSIFGGIAWPLSSFSIFITNSWWIFSGVTAWFPWIMLFGFKLLKKPTFRNLSLLLIFRLLLFYVGHIEYFIHCIIFEFLSIVLIGISLYPQNFDFSFIKKYAVSYPITLIYTLPILLPGWFRMKVSGIRSEHFEFTTLHANAMNLSDWMMGLFNPFKLNPEFYLREQSKFSFGTFPHLSHIGYITILLILFCIIYSFFKKKFHKQHLFKIVIFVLFLISLLWSFGMLAGLLYYIPILNRFRFPFKLLAFSNFYLIFVACFGFCFLAKLIRNLKLKRVIQSLLIILSLVNFYLLYSHVYVSLNYHDHFDKIPLEEPYLDNLKNGRIFSLAVSESDPFSIRTLGFNYPLLLGLNHFAGYDPLMPQKNFYACLNIKYRAVYNEAELPIEYLRKWGVNWYILNKNANPEPMFSHYRQILENDSLSVFADDPKRTIFLDKKALPLVFWEKSETAENINYELKNSSILLKTNSNEDKYIIVNWLNNDFFKTTLNDETQIPIRETDIGQMKLFVPKGENWIKIKYVNPHFRWGLLVVLGVSLLLIVLKFLTNNKSLKL